MPPEALQKADKYATIGARIIRVNKPQALHSYKKGDILTMKQPTGGVDE
jgi:hypothetical protein